MEVCKIGMIYAHLASSGFRRTADHGQSSCPNCLSRLRSVASRAIGIACPKGIFGLASALLISQSEAYSPSLNPFLTVAAWAPYCDNRPKKGTKMPSTAKRELIKNRQEWVCSECGRKIYSLDCVLTGLRMHEITQLVRRMREQAFTKHVCFSPLENIEVCFEVQ